MNNYKGAWILLVALAIQGEVVFAQTSLNLQIRSKATQVDVSWPASLELQPGQRIYPEYEVQKSSDLEHWKPIGGKVRAIEGISGDSLKLSLPHGENSFYRVIGRLDSPAATQTAVGGAEVFGYGTRFAQELKSLGQISPQDFLGYDAGAAYLPRLTWNPTTALYWTNFYTHPSNYNASLPPGSNDQRMFDFKLNAEELAVFMTNGFVVSERLGSQSFAETYYRIFNDDLPVFITADSVLHAWHRTYLSMLEELEEVQLSRLLETILNQMAARVTEAWQQHGHGPLRDSILDADYFLTVARSLLFTNVTISSALGQSDLVASTLDAIKYRNPNFPLFGTNRRVDFSQFKLRGHYESSSRLGRYFRAMMWCSRIDLRIPDEPNKGSLREFGTAIVLHDLFQRSNQSNNWSALEKVITTFVGVNDSMNFLQLGDLLASANVRSLADIPDASTLNSLHLRLLTGELGVQNIRGDVYVSPLGPEQIKLPRSFTFLGQRFLMDSWVLSQIVFDSVIWDTNGIPEVTDKVLRRKPSSLDVAFAVFGNDQIVPELVARIIATNGVPFRDGLPYQHNLTAARNVINQQDPSIWTNNIYNAWLAAIRELSEPTTGPEYPEAMRTRAWALRTLNTQLASWTELRHDTVLYAKQSYSGTFICSYPEGFVEPRPRFWQKIRELAEVTSAGIAQLSMSGSVEADPRHPDYPRQMVDLQAMKAKQLAALQNFAATAATLESIAAKEIRQQPLISAETDFLQDWIELRASYARSTPRDFNGFYPNLFYRNVFQYLRFERDEGSDKWDALVADIHTDPPDPFVGDPGAVIHQGLGSVHLLLIAVDNGPDRMVYAGPLLSHYEFEVPGVNRLSDSEWKARLRAGNAPPHPEWTRSYLVPGPFTVPPGY